MASDFPLGVILMVRLFRITFLMLWLTVVSGLSAFGAGVLLYWAREHFTPLQAIRIELVVFMPAFFILCITTVMHFCPAYKPGMLFTFPGDRRHRHESAVYAASTSARPR